MPPKQYALLSITHKGSHYHLKLPGYGPRDVCSLLFRAFEAEGSPLVSNMGRLAMHIIEQSVKVSGSCLLGWDALQKERINKDVDAIYHIERPDRSVRIKMETVRPTEEREVYREKVYDGPFLQFKRHLVSIMDNHKLEEKPA